MPQKIRMYSTQWCADCRTAKRFLKSRDISFEEVDIDKDEQSAQRVISWSGGRRVIPTFEIYCGVSSAKPVILHNPRLHELADVLRVRS
ncbi:MAG TPA: glutaredoxin domain-containing protein [Bacteroidota bacterium]|nr:glutaredoxin domain-containing protein [Bacteroidota bacterium]